MNEENKWRVQQILMMCVVIAIVFMVWQLGEQNVFKFHEMAKEFCGSGFNSSADIMGNAQIWKINASSLVVPGG